MARQTGGPFRLYLDFSVRTMGLEWVIEQLGARQIIEQLGARRIIQLLGVKRVLEELGGVKQLVAELSPEQRRELKRLLMSESRGPKRGAGECGRQRMAGGATLSKGRQG